MAKPTPGPWELAFPYIFASGEHGANICVIGEPRATNTVSYTPLEIGSKDIAEASANAEFMVHACNNFNDLLEAAAWLVAHHTDRDPDTGYSQETYQQAWGDLEKAVAKAEGQS